jgi:hypothetical protein
MKNLHNSQDSLGIVICSPLSETGDPQHVVPSPEGDTAHFRTGFVPKAGCSFFEEEAELILPPFFYCHQIGPAIEDFTLARIDLFPKKTLCEWLPWLKAKFESFEKIAPQIFIGMAAKFPNSGNLESIAPLPSAFSQRLLQASGMVSGLPLSWFDIVDSTRSVP